MTQFSRKGFVDKNGKKVVIVPPKEEYAGENVFQDSEAIDAILTEGVHHISYKKDGKKYPTQHILVVTRDYGKTGPIAPTREIVHQLLIDDFGGMMKRYRKFTDTELLEPDGEWTEWTSVIPTIDIDSSITEDGYNPVTGAAVYDALLGKMANLRSMRITYDRVEEEFVVSESDKAVLVTFRNSAPADTFVPVLVSLYEGDTKNSDVFGLAKWSEEQQPTITDINILVVIGEYYFSANGNYQEIEDILFSGWTRTVQGQSFFS